MKLGISIIALNVALIGALAPAAVAQKWSGKTDDPFYRSRYVAVTERLAAGLRSPVDAPRGV